MKIFINEHVPFVAVFLSLSLSFSNVFCENYEDKIMKYFEIGDFASAEEILSYKVKNYNKLLYFRALEKFYQAKYKEALNLLQEVLSEEGNRRNEEYASLYIYISTMVKISENFKLVETTHTLFYVSENDSILIPYAKEYIEYIYPLLNEKFNITPKDKVVVEVYPDIDSFSIASTLTNKEIATSGAVGICKFNRIMILSPQVSPFGYHWVNTLSHEYAHYLINKISKLNTPLWLNEGIARYFDTYWEKKKSLYLSPDVEDTLYDVVTNDKFIPFSRMVPSLAKLNSHEEVNIAFAEVSSIVDYIITQYGEENLFRLLYELGKDEKDVVGKAFKKILNKSEEELEVEWRSWVKTKQFSKYSGIISKKVEFGKDADEITAFVPLSVQKYIRLGDSYRKQRDYKSALYEYRKAAKQQPYNSVVLTKIGVALLLLGSLEEAKENFLRAINTNAPYTAPYIYLSKIYIMEKKIDLAIQYLKKSICINPYNPEIHKILGHCYYTLGNTVEARNEWERVLSLTPGDVEVKSFLNQIVE